MVAEILADRRQIVDDLDAEALEQAAAADAGQLQQARRIDGAAARRSPPCAAFTSWTVRLRSST